MEWCNECGRFTDLPHPHLLATYEKRNERRAYTLAIITAILTAAKIVGRIHSGPISARDILTSAERECGVKDDD